MTTWWKNIYCSETEANNLADGRHLQYLNVASWKLEMKNVCHVIDKMNNLPR